MRNKYLLIGIFSWVYYELLCVILFNNLKTKHMKKLFRSSLLGCLFFLSESCKHCLKDKTSWAPFDYNKSDTLRFLSAEISLEEAIIHATCFKTSTQISIPISWEFEAVHLRTLLDQVITNTNDTADGIRFYASVDPNDSINHTLKIIAVAYNISGGDTSDMANSQNPLQYKLFNFSKICPYHCAHNSPMRVDDLFLGKACN